MDDYNNKVTKDPRHNAWNFSSVFFFFLLLAGTGFLLRKKGIDIKEMAFRESLVIVLATYRLTRIVVFEQIFKFIRNTLKRHKDHYVIGTIHAIITCPWCSGVWVSLIIIFFYYLVPFGDLMTYVLALAGIASLLILLSNLTHMWAERKQRLHRRDKNSD